MAGQGKRATAVAAVALLAGGCEGDSDRGPTRNDEPQTRLYRVPTEQMEPTLRVGDVVQVDRAARRLARGDVVIFRPPANAEANECAAIPRRGQACPRSSSATSPIELIKRVVAVGGDRVSIAHGRVLLDGKLQDEPYIGADATCGVCHLPTPLIVPRGQLYVLGDNRGQNSDSRHWGPIRRKWVVGKVVSP